MVQLRRDVYQPYSLHSPLPSTSSPLTLQTGPLYSSFAWLPVSESARKLVKNADSWESSLWGNGHKKQTIYPCLMHNRIHYALSCILSCTIEFTTSLGS